MQINREYVKAQRALIEKARDSGDEQQMASCLYDLGMYFEGCCMYPLATCILGEASQLFKRLIPNHERTRLSVVSLASVHAKRGKIFEAEKLYEELLSSRCRELGWKDHHDAHEGCDQGNMAAVYIVRNKCVVRFQ